MSYSDEPHNCRALTNVCGAYGAAVDACWECEEGHFWVGNGEYQNQVDFCPFCGTKAPVRAYRFKGRAGIEVVAEDSPATAQPSVDLNKPRRIVT